MESATGKLQAASVREGSFRWQEVCGLFLPDDNMQGQIALAHPTSIGLRKLFKVSQTFKLAIVHRVYLRSVLPVPNATDIPIGCPSSGLQPFTHRTKHSCP
jgi:hypothetical protein